MKLANVTAVKSVETLEAIDYQRNDRFGPELETIVGQFVDMVKSGTASKYIEGNKELKDKFNKLVLDRTGINVYLITDKQMAGIIPNVYTPNNSLLTSETSAILSGELNSLHGTGLLYNKSSDFKLGAVDYKNARISGWFSQQPLPLFINFIELINEHGLTVPEITAVILHELGHAFEGASEVSKLNSSNRVIADAVKRINGVAPEERQEFVYKELQKLDQDLSVKDVEGLQSSNPVVFGVSTFRTVISIVRSLSGSSRHDTTAFESLSDSFATRFGYAEYLATGLDKIVNDRKTRLTQECFSILRAYLVFDTVVGILSIIRLIFNAKGHAVEEIIKFALSRLVSVIPNAYYSLRFIKNERESSRDMTYDLNKDRFIRVRNDLVNSMKDPAIDIKTRRAVLEQIKFIDTIVDKTSNQRGYLNLLGLIISPKDRSTYNAIKAQQEVEKMIANDIFVSVSKLKAQ